MKFYTSNIVQVNPIHSAT